MQPAAQALLRPLRTRILAALAEPASAAAVARKLEMPRQKVGYHLRELEKHGLVELVEERKQGNCMERIVRATPRAYLVSAEALGALAAGAEATTDCFSSARLVGVAAQAAREAARLRGHAESAKKKMPTLTLQTEIRFATPSQRAMFANDLAAAVAKLTAKYHRADAAHGRTYRLAALAYPKPSSDEP